MESANITTVKTYLLSLQNRLCSVLETLDQKSLFRSDVWQHHSGGHGNSMVLKQGGLFEQAGVNFSHVTGASLPPSSTAHRPELIGSSFEALGLSTVIHPQNPHIPTSHMNVRFFMAHTPQPVWWFGGGFDLTPFYPVKEDVVHWHTVARNLCEPFGSTVYPEYKKWCDDYFFLTHRQEPRGVGGIFFDDVNHWDFTTCFTFMEAVGNGFIDAYIPIVERRKDTPWTEAQRQFQLYRRGRYVEFNLVYDRGTLFGLQSGGRTESILMSLPPLVRWDYNFQPSPGSSEAALYETFLPIRDWASEP